MTPALSIIIPTIGRPTLCNTLASLRGQLQPQDEVLIEFDEPRTGNWGERPRDKAIRRALGTHLMFMDDDDTFTPNALEIVRKYVSALPDSLHLFQAVWHNNGAPGRVRHDKHEFSGGQCPTPTIVVPRTVAPRWTQIGANVHQDLEYAKLCAGTTYPHIPQWIDEVICNVRPLRDDNPYVTADVWLINKRESRRPR